MINLKTLCSLLIFLLILINSSAAQEKSPVDSSPKTIAETKRFESKEGNFSINISSAPFQTRNLGSEKATKKWVNKGNQFFWRIEKTVYTVLWAGPFDSDKEQMPLNLEAMNTVFRKSIGVDGKLISEKEISYGVYQGREFRFIAPNGVKYIMRNYLVENTGYILSAGYVEDKDEKEAIEVLDSFRLLNEKN